MRAQPLTDTSASLEWLPGDNSVIDRYYIRWSNIADSTDSGEAFSFVTSYDVTGLQSGATYSFNVAAVNQDGTSPFSDTASLTLEEPQSGNLHLLAIYVYNIHISRESIWRPYLFLNFLYHSIV